MSALYELLEAACTPGGRPSFIRIRAHFVPVAGPGTIVAPPTYSGVDKQSRYVFEQRWFDGVARRCVRIDSVQSQANRVEAALDELADDQVECGGGGLPIPRCIIAFEGRSLSSLALSHRVHDAELFHTFTAGGEAFGDCEVGKAVLNATPHDAGALLRYAPNVLAFGAWDAHGRGSGARFPRAYESRMTGVAAGDVQAVPRAATKYDPLNLHAPARTIKLDKTTGGWELTSKPGPGGVALSNVGLGSVPSFQEDLGGVAVEYVERLAVLQLTTLRNLRFVLRGGDPAANVAGRAMVAAYALLGDRLAFGETGCTLRSGCSLERQSEQIEAVGADELVVQLGDARTAYAEAVDEARRHGLEVSEEDIYLHPSAELAKVWAITTAMVGEEAEAETA
jgi:CRISPR-associated protein Csb1